MYEIYYIKLILNPKCRNMKKFQKNLFLEEILNKAYQDYRELLRRHAHFKIGDPALAEDLVQTTFLKTWHYLLKGGKIKAMKSFLYHILNNLVVDEYRKKRTVSLDMLEEKGV